MWFLGGERKEGKNELAEVGGGVRMKKGVEEGGWRRRKEDKGDGRRGSKVRARKKEQR
jgi:hypothetical protein